MVHLGGMPLSSLDLRGCSLIDDDGIQRLQHLPLTELFLGGCKLVTELGVSYLRQMPLRSLDLRGCAIDSTAARIAERLGGLQLAYLDLGILRRLRGRRTAVSAGAPIPPGVPCPGRIRDRWGGGGPPGGPQAHP